MHCSTVCRSRKAHLPTIQRDTAIPLPNRLQAMKTTSFLPSLLLFVLVLPCCCVLDSRTVAQDSDKLKIASTNTTENKTQCQQTCQIGLTQDRPANSCIDIYDCNGNNAKSGWYWIAGQSSDNSSHQFYCELEEKRCGIVGMMRVANVNTSDPYLQCPPPLAQYWAEDKRVCGPSLDERCDPVVFPVHGQSYNYVCGRALGYSFNRPWAFHYSNTRSLSQNYLTGLSITQGSLSDNHSHVWSYAAGRQEERAAGCNCPCANDPGRQPPSYVGSDYYCDTARMTSTSQQWHHNNTLWDGIDCYSGSKCCTNTRLPWFWRALNQQTTNDITVRWCASRELWIDNFGTELLEIYVF